MSLSDVFSPAIAIAALLVSFLAFQRAGHRRLADLHQEWLRELRTKVAELLSIVALKPSDVEFDTMRPRSIDHEGLTFIVEYICLLLDERGNADFKELRGAVVKLALFSSSADITLAAAIDEVTNKAKSILRSEAKRIERELKRIL